MCDELIRNSGRLQLQPFSHLQLSVRLHIVLVDFSIIIDMYLSRGWCRYTRLGGNSSSEAGVLPVAIPMAISTTSSQSYDVGLPLTHFDLYKIGIDHPSPPRLNCLPLTHFDLYKRIGIHVPRSTSAHTFRLVQEDWYRSTSWCAAVWAPWLVLL